MAERASKARSLCVPNERQQKLIKLYSAINCSCRLAERQPAGPLSCEAYASRRSSSTQSRSGDRPCATLGRLIVERMMIAAARKAGLGARRHGCVAAAEPRHCATGSCMPSPASCVAETAGVSENRRDLTMEGCHHRPWKRVNAKSRRHSDWRRSVPPSKGDDLDMWNWNSRDPGRQWVGRHIRNLNPGLKRHPCPNSSSSRNDKG